MSTNPVIFLRTAKKVCILSIKRFYFSSLPFLILPLLCTIIPAVEVIFFLNNENDSEFIRQDAVVPL